ncbi:NAD(P)/FAD-dependent oxidoreductase [Halorubellus salinus]|uniref:NAD(P)/FAD-dependent oxidoreductase n=1 Tax=Halorubellus salinus TaxID=755309 RepID=UPI001D08DEF8|nr:FAD-dependent oxidoreductase [Halorubellus salinus]
MTHTTSGDGRRVVVVGAGIAGACVADHLARETECDVVVLDRAADSGTETTAKSGGFVGFWGHESPACVPLLGYGMRYYQRLLSGTDPPARFVHGGRLRVATTAAGDADVRADFADAFGRSTDGETTTECLGAPVQYLPGDRLGETLVLPGLDTGAVTGALYSPGVGHIDDPGSLSRGVLDRATSNGATVRTNATVTGLSTPTGEATTVHVEGDAVDQQADAVVAAAGPWNRPLLESAGVSLPVRNTRGPMLALDGEHHGLPALFHEESGVYTRQNRDGTRYVGHFPGQYDAASVLDPDDVPTTVSSSRRASCLDAVADLCPAMRDAAVVDDWVGVRQVTPDGDPIVDEADVDGLSVVAFNANGIQYAPAAGRIIADQITGREPSLPDAGVAFDRFEDSQFERQ